jgi:hypothetical protein
MQQQDAQRQRAKRTALVLACLALAIYAGYIIMSVRAGH